MLHVHPVSAREIRFLEVQVGCLFIHDQIEPFKASLDLHVPFSLFLVLVTLTLILIFFFIFVLDVTFLALGTVFLLLVNLGLVLLGSLAG